MLSGGQEWNVSDGWPIPCFGWRQEWSPKGGTHSLFQQPNQRGAPHLVTSNSCHMQRDSVHCGQEAQGAAGGVCFRCPRGKVLWSVVVGGQAGNPDGHCSRQMPQSLSSYFRYFCPFLASVSFYWYLN